MCRQTVMVEAQRHTADTRVEWNLEKKGTLYKHEVLGKILDTFSMEIVMEERKDYPPANA